MKIYKPTTPARRGMIGVDYGLLTETKPYKKLTKGLVRRAGRSKAQGRITVRHRGGGSKRKYRIIDFKQDKINIPAKVVSIEYDPSRTTFISLLNYADGEKRYILSPNGLRVGDEIIVSDKAEPKTGNRMRLKNIPIGFEVHSVELSPGKGAKIIRSAGSYATIIAKDAGMAHLEFPSTEIRMVPEDCFASIGQLSNPGHNQEVLGKAGKTRQRGKRPHVRGSAMNPVDHPHGGGEGRAPIGLKHPKTPWGRPALGVKTRKKKKYSNKFIVRRRKIKRK